MAIFVTTCSLRNGCGTWIATLVAEAASAELVDGIARMALVDYALGYVGCEPPLDLNAFPVSAFVRALAEAVTKDAPVQISRPYPAVDTVPDTALNTAFVDVTALDPKSPKPFWDLPWCPPELFTLLFEGPGRTYLIVDAGKYSKIAEDFDRDTIADMHRVECLYEGGTAQELQDVAPYLVDVTLDGSEPTDLHRDYFKRHWGKGSGLFIRSDLKFDDLRKHLRCFTRIRSNDTTDAWTFFRFWDPLVARIYFRGIDQRTDRVARFFRTPTSTLEFVIEYGTDVALHLWPADLTDDTSPEMRTPLVFDATDHALMDQVALAGLGQELVDWLASEHPERFAGFTPAQFGNIAHHVLTQGKSCGCETKDDFAYLAQLMLTLGGWFHRSAVPALLVEIIGNTGARRKVLESAFLVAWEDTAQSALVEQFADVHAYLAALSKDEIVSSLHFRTLCKRFLSSKRQAVDDAIKAAKDQIAELNLSETQAGRFLVLTIILGYHFHEDPFHPWVHRDAP